MTKMICLIALLSCILVSCLNSSTAFSWRSVSYQTTPEAGGNVTVTEKQGASSVNAEKTTSDAFKAENPTDAKNAQ